MIAASLGAIVLAGILATALMIGRSGTRLVNYSAMETQTRRAFEQLAIDARMANAFTATFTSGQITSFTLTIPSNDLSTIRQVTYGYDVSVPTNKKFFFVAGNDPTVMTGRSNLITNVKDLRILRYDNTDTLLTSTTNSTGIKHLQISVNVERTGVSVAAASQVIRSTAFTLRNM